MTLDEIARDVLLRWKAHPISMVRELFHAEPDPWQAEGLEVFPTSTASR